MNDWLMTIGALLGGGAGGGVVVKWMSRDTDDATAEELRARARGSDLDTLRGVIAELRTDKAEQAERIKNIEQRLTQVEDRERHMLTRAAVHEAWDQLAIAFILTHDQNFPKPPPLANPKPDEE